MYRPRADNFRRYFFVSRYSLYTELILGCLQIQSGVICSVSIWTLSEAKLQAAQAHQTWKSPSELTEGVTKFRRQEETLKIPPYRLKPTPILMAAPENFNPDLQLPPALREPPQNSSPPTTSTEPRKLDAVLESIYTDYRYDTDNFDQTNLFFEPRIQFQLNNGNKIFIKTGFNFFEQRGVESVTNFPLQVGWQGKIGETTLQTAAGVDVFNRLPTVINLNAKVEVPISRPRVSSSGQLLSAVVLSGNLEQGPYKSNARTLDNQITAWRFGPDLYWQIDRNTSLFSSLRLGSYNDGNAEVQSFSKLERKFGQFSLAANLFNWSFDRNLERTSGYFSPPDFLVYNAEVAWEGDISNFLRCRLAANLGQQRLQGEFDNAHTYQTRCTVKLSPNIETDLGYSFSNVRNQETGGSAYGGNSLTGQLRVKF
ncbi:hypothetical protein LC608_06295 [Nostoc sp. XA010]|uniref:hypothetical protein n=1 Tax=Nostoc sp. XA010 TaxID=2780407 RepID=UPI001E64E79A|nr:hypothetical protein [Nostoc sp. XA010]MCC5656595.1 hypothetical protein [Nostoc sp. XA010]